MSEAAPCNAPSIGSPSAHFAFFGVGGPQDGKIFALDSTKTVLQFDSTINGARTSPTRCLVVRSENGISIRTLEGDMAVNDRATREAWLQPNDEVSCGTARLRLIGLEITPTDHDQHPETQPSMDGPCDAISPTHTSPSISSVDAPPRPNYPPLGPEPREGTPVAAIEVSPSEPFFAPFTPDESSEMEVADNATVCLNPEDIKKLLEPTVYASDEPSQFTVETPQTPCDGDTEKVAAAAETDTTRWTPQPSPEPAVDFDDRDSLWTRPSASTPDLELPNPVHSTEEPARLASVIESVPCPANGSAPCATDRAEIPEVVPTDPLRLENPTSGDISSTDRGDQDLSWNVTPGELSTHLEQIVSSNEELIDVCIVESFAQWLSTEIGWRTVAVPPQVDASEGPVGTGVQGVIVH